MSRYTIAINKPIYPSAFYYLCLVFFIMTQLTTMATDFIILGLVAMVFIYPAAGIIGYIIAFIALGTWRKTAFMAWKKENIIKFYKVMCVYE